MYGMASTTTRMVKGILLLHLSSTPPSSLLRITRDLSRPFFLSSLQLQRSHPATAIRCASSASDSGNNKVSSRLSQVHELLQEAEHRSISADYNAPIPKITLGLFCFHQFSHSLNIYIYMLQKTCFDFYIILLGFRSCYCEFCQKWRTWGSECQ
jgi:hypothetical protein